MSEERKTVGVNIELVKKQKTLKGQADREEVVNATWMRMRKGIDRWVYYLNPQKYAKNQFTLTASPPDYIELPAKEIKFAYMLQKIELIFNDGTSKAVTLYMVPSVVSPIWDYSSSFPPRYFLVTGNLDPDIVIVLEENENEFARRTGIRIMVTGTSGKKVQVLIYIKKLRQK